MTDKKARAAEHFELRKWAGFDASERVMGIGTGKPQTRLSLALSASQVSRNKLRRWKDQARTMPPTAVVEHMPFAGHRTCAQWMAQQEAAHKRSADYGYDLDGIRRGSR